MSDDDKIYHICYMKDYVMDSFKFGGDNDAKQKEDNSYNKVTPFLFDKTSRGEPTITEVFFIDSEDTTGK